MHARADNPPHLAVTTALATALAILIALAALAFGIASASLGTKPPATDSGAG